MSSPQLPTAFDPATCVRKGLCPVTKIRGQEYDPLESHSLYYEQHGRGTEYKVVFIMGLNSSAFAWGPQVRHFGTSDTHTALVFDNRGVGNSGYPRGPYTCVQSKLLLLRHSSLLLSLGRVAWRKMQLPCLITLDGPQSESCM
jgi:pimeloyl-ACP methyl ester carboxylesterase